MKYVDTEALARLFGKVLPFSADYFAKQIEKTLVKINAGMVRPEYAGAADVLLANNRANKQGIWKATMIMILTLLLNTFLTTMSQEGNLTHPSTWAPKLVARRTKRIGEYFTI